MADVLPCRPTMVINATTSWRGGLGRPLARVILLAKDEQRERLGLYCGARPRIGGRRRWRRTKFGSDGIDVVILCVERHGTRPALGRKRLDNRILIGRILMRHRNRTIAARCEYQPRSRIEAVRVHTLADRNGGYFISVGVVDNRDDPAVATRKEPFMHGIDSQSGWLVAARHGPRVEYLECLGIECDDLIFVFVVDIDMALAICLSCFRLATERYAAQDFSRPRVDRGSVIAGRAVHCENALGGRVVNNSIRSAIRYLNFTDRCARFQIVDAHGMGVAIGSEYPLQIGRKFDAVRALHIWDVADHLALGVQHHGVRACLLYTS